jgi:hypothetical protein
MFSAAAARHSLANRKTLLVDFLLLALSLIVTGKKVRGFCAVICRILENCGVSYLISTALLKQKPGGPHSLCCF